MVQKLGHELGEYLAALQPVAVLREHSGPTPGRRAKVPRTSGTEDCSPIAPSAGVPTGCRRTLAAARRSAIAPAGSRDGLPSRKAAKGYGSARATHRAQASGSFSADGPSAPAPQAKCTKTADPDPKIPPACKPPPIRDRKTESANPRYGQGFFSKLLERLRESNSQRCLGRGGG